MFYLRWSPALPGFIRRGAVPFQPRRAVVWGARRWATLLIDDRAVPGRSTLAVRPYFMRPRYVTSTVTGTHSAIYLSVPFCRTKCSFCNFASGVFRRDLLD